MKTIFITPHGDLMYGGEKSLLLLLRELRGKGVDATVICPETGCFGDTLRAEGFKTIILAVNNLTSRNALNYISSLFGLWKIVRTITPDIIHCNSASVAQIVIPVARLFGPPVIVHARTELTRDNVRRYLLDYADMVIFNSEFGRTSAVQYLKKGSKNGVIYNPIENLSCKEKSGTISNVLFLGQLAPHKGCDTFLRMAKKLIGNGSMANFIIAGGEIPSAMGYADALKNSAKEQGIINRMRFNDNVDAEMLLTNAAVVVVPSRNETFGRVAAEAMMAGRPVVASRVGGLPEVVEDNVTGFLVEPDDGDGFSDKVQFLLNNRDKADAMGRAGRERAIRLFSPEEHANKVMEVYKKVLA